MVSKLAGLPGERTPRSTPAAALVAAAELLAPVFFDFGGEGEGEGGCAGDFEFHAAVCAPGDLSGEWCAIEADGPIALGAGGCDGLRGGLGRCGW